jgi:hypothetical protein
MKPSKPGVITAIHAIRTHFANIEIHYDARQYGFTYLSSQNLLYDGSTVHRSYNRWVRRLDQAITSELSRKSLLI